FSRDWSSDVCSSDLVVAWGYASSAVPSLVEEAAGGVVVPPGDPKGQAAAILGLLEDEAALAAARANARAYARTHDVALSAARLEELYAGLVAARRAEAAGARGAAAGRRGEAGGDGRGRRPARRPLPRGEGART